MRKYIKTALRILLGLVLAAAVMLILLQIGVRILYRDYYRQAQAAFVIPGITEGFVPQGFDYDEQSDYFLMCGYMADGSASRVYVRHSDGTVIETDLMYDEQTPYTRHSGGICHNGEYVYIASSGGVDVFLLSDVLSDGAALRQGSIAVGYGVAYCDFHDGYLLCGNFYHPGSHETPQLHRISTPVGDENVALISVFRADEQEAFGIDPMPVAALSTQGEIQGICFMDQDRAVLSASYGATSSRLYFYEFDPERCGSVYVLDHEVPLYYLDSENLIDTVKLPPMSEELVYHEGRVYIMCESASNKYWFGKLIYGFLVYGYDPGG